MKIDCLQLRNKIAEKIQKNINILVKKGVTPTFAIIQIGDNPNSNAYIRVKTKKAEEMGIRTQVFKFEIRNSKFETNSNLQNIRKNPHEIRENPDIQQNKIEKLIIKLNNDASIHGIIIQRPLPHNIDEEKLQSLISLNKDIDGLSKNSPFINPLVAAVEHVIHFALSQNLLRTTYYVLRTVVVGKGITAGGPIFEYFSNHPKIQLRTTDYVLRTQQIDSQTKNPTEILKSADIIISCVGKERIIRPDNIKKNVILISVGQHQSKISNFKFQISNSGRWAGDYDELEIAAIASAYTPTPGGIGPLNVIFLLQNVINAIK